MHYYKKNLGDYYKKAGRLSILQHGVFNLLIDACYDREKFPTHDQAIEWTWASTQEEIDAVEFVLKRLFTLENGVYVQKRIREELAGYADQIAKNTLNGMKGGRPKKEPKTPKTEPKTPKTEPKKTQPVNKKTQKKPNQEPRTNNQEPETKNHDAHQHDDKFEMHDNWQPDQTFSDQCRLAGIDFEKIPIDRGKQILAEFMGYWTSVSKKRMHTHREWQHKLLQQFIRESQTGDLYDEKRHRTDQQRLTDFASNIYDYQKATDF